MPNVKKPGWEYFYSEVIKQEIARNLKTGLIYCEDHTIYQPRELRILGKNKVTLGLHNIKRLFGGEIIK